MKTNEIKTITAVPEEKAIYNKPVIEIVIFAVDDIITTSGGFGGEDDII